MNYWISSSNLYREQSSCGGRFAYFADFLRDLIIGMTLVLADGAIARTGGKVVKNVAGYDLHKLLTGSFGTLGVITEVNFRLHPLEQHARTFTATATDPSAFARPLRELLHAQMTPSSIQLRLTQNHAALDLRQRRAGGAGFL